MLSFTENSNCKKFGDWRIGLTKPEKLLARLEEKLPKTTGLELVKVEYNKNEISQDLTPSQFIDRKFYSKPPRYSNEREWRVLIRLPCELWPIMNDTLQWNVDEILDVFSNC